MIPVRTRASNFVYRGPTPDIGDAWVERRGAGGGVFLDWLPSDDERKAIAAGALIRLGMFGPEPIVPVSLDVSPYDQLGDAATALRDRATAILKALSPKGMARVPAGWWSVSADVWSALNSEGALDASPGIPRLIERPLMVTENAPADTLEYLAS